jgi:hypothetical protein
VLDLISNRAHPAGPPRFAILFRSDPCAGFDLRTLCHTVRLQPGFPLPAFLQTAAFVRCAPISVAMCAIARKRCKMSVNAEILKESSKFDVYH